MMELRSRSGDQKRGMDMRRNKVKRRKNYIKKNDPGPMCRSLIGTKMKNSLPMALFRTRHFGCRTGDPVIIIPDCSSPGSNGHSFHPELHPGLSFITIIITLQDLWDRPVASAGFQNTAKNTPNLYGKI
jgi:hypothetical protein